MPVPVLGLGLLTTVLSVGTVVGVQVAGDEPAPRAAFAPYSCATSNGFTGWCVDADSCVDLWTKDTNGNGYYDELWADLFTPGGGQACKADTHVRNTIDYDDPLDDVRYDLNENGRAQVWITSTYDETAGALVTTTCVDINEDGIYDNELGACFATVPAVVGAPSYDGLAGLLVALAQGVGTVVG